MQITGCKYFSGLIFFCCSFYTSAQNYQIDIDFDTSSTGVFIDTSLTSNVWQIGAPQKTFFTSALTLPNAIVTDTINTYPPNNYSAFYITLPNVYWSGVHLQFKHKYDTDSLIDGGKIEVSSDMANWTNIINDSFNLFNPETIGFYTTQNSISSMSDFGFSGKSNGWQFSQCGWNYPNIDTLYLRFVFSSASNQTNKDGWMIDSIRIRTDLGIGMNETGDENSFRIFPNPTSSQLTVRSSEFRDKKIEHVEIYDVLGQCVFSQKPEANSQQLVIDVTILKSGIYFLKIIGEQERQGAKFVKE